MSEPSAQIHDSETAIYLTRLDADAFELDVPRPVVLTAEQIRALGRRFEAEAGSAFTRTVRQDG
jgi:hypothetical protein